MVTKKTPAAKKAPDVKKKTENVPAAKRAQATVKTSTKAKTKNTAAPANGGAKGLIPTYHNGNKNIRVVNVALQGGGAHGAFAWGVLDKFIEDGRLEIEGVSGTSAGSMNAVVYAFGKLKGNDGAREALHNFWKAISDAGQKYSPVKRMPWEQMMSGFNMKNSMASEMFKLVTSTFSPYQLNPFDFNPLRDVLEEQVDFEKLERESKTKLFLSTTNVRTGKVRVFNTEEVTADVVLASACLPNLFKAVEIDGEHYWDGGYMGNPVLYPLFYHTVTRDVIILHINPIERAGPPTGSNEIANRINEITFNSSLIKEMRSVHFVQKLLDDGWIKDEFRDRLKYVLIHSVRADNALNDLSVESKFASEWDFLTMLRDRGRACATEWLARNYSDVGERSSVDLRKEFL
jgi:NTE family protein